MARFINALLVLLIILSAAAVYDMKYEAELAETELRQVERQIVQERETISLLKAEWSVLTQPGRLQQLIERHADVLKLVPLTSAQFGTLADIPEKPVLLDPEVHGPGEGVMPAAPVQRRADAGGAPAPIPQAAR